MYFGQNIKHLRKSKNWSQEDLAKQFGLQNSSVGKWEKGHNFPSAAILVELSSIFSVPIDDLMKTDLTQTTAHRRTDRDDDLAEIWNELRRLSAEVAGTDVTPAEVAALQQLRDDLRTRYPDIAKELGIPPA